MTHRSRLHFPLASLLLAAPVFASGATEEAAAGASPAPDGDTVQPAELEARIAELELRLAELETPAARTTQQAPQAQQAQPAPQGGHPVPQEATHAVRKGFWPVPNSEFEFKIGGYVKLDVIHDFNEIGNRYKFQTQTISVPEESDSVTTIHARESRLNFDMRGPLGDKDLRIFVEGDFFGDGNSFELRHAYGQWGEWLAGQTWTTYMDLSSRPHTLDFEGPDGELFVRQAMVRWTHPTSGKNSFSLALEGSSSDITVLDDLGGQDETPLPDLAGNYRIEGDGRHVQLSGVLRYLELEGEGGADDEDALGWGVAVSGKTELGSAANRLMGQVAYGEGSAHYNQATRGTGSDAVLGPDGSLETLPILTAVLGLEHDWCDQWTSTLAASFADVDTEDYQAPDAIDQSMSASANIVWHPYERFLVGAEYLYGERENVDGESGLAHRVQFSFKFLF